MFLLLFDSLCNSIDYNNLLIVIKTDSIVNYNDYCYFTKHMHNV